ncbi:PPE family protein [Mycobacterium kubicae]|uniref:PPE family protein n=1 Tax=Mycobacterium kubicae TaxID=120959 RepID=UPI0016416A2F|nr:PPE family protein [Mycobacterium kubicae]QNI08230.1 PPE family protein [Mycobacterium kubicae]
MTLPVVSSGPAATPFWIASPPEVHSALLSSGAGPGPLLAAAAAWHSLSVEYAETAHELTAVLAAVQAGTWAGPTATAYVTAHTPYLAWLTQASADSAAMAAQQEVTAAAYTTALAAMPTLAELAANHATHAVLVATNFFGINTIPIALNEADYVRMWIQAATVMSTYQAVSTAALASSPQTFPAPEIVKADAQQVAAAEATELPRDRQNEFLQWLQDLGYLDFYDNYIQPLINALSELPYFQALFSGFDPYLVILGNPLSYLSPFNIAFALGYPMDFGTYAALLSQMFAFVALDLTAAFASGDPATIGLTILFTTVEVIGTVITDTIALLKTLLEQTAVLLTVLVPLLTSPLVPLAAGVVLAPIGIKGLAMLAPMPPAPFPAPPPAAPPLVALAPGIPTTTAPAPAPAPASASAPAPAPPPPPTAAPPPVTGSGLPVGMESFGYLVGDLDLTAKSAAGTAARKKAPEPDTAEVPAVAATPREQPRVDRRRKAKANKLGRGYEYADLEPDPDDDGDHVSSGFVGVSRKTGTASGLKTLTGNGFDDGPHMPMMPSTWDADPPETR